jgi:hydroxyacylglutathione hydrolase
MSARPHVETITVGPLQVNCYLLGDPSSKEAVLIDPGDEAGRILRAVTGGGWKIREVLVTHAHFDHVLAAREVIAALGVPFRVPAGEWDKLRTAAATALIWTGQRFSEPPEPDGGLSEGEAVGVGRYAFRVLATPGHSPDSVSLVGEGLAFTGDVLFAGSVGRTDLPGGDWDTLMKSIREKLLPLDETTVVYPGHGPATTLGRERVTNPFVVPLTR